MQEYCLFVCLFVCLLVCLLVCLFVSFFVSLFLCLCVFSCLELTLELPQKVVWLEDWGSRILFRIWYCKLQPLFSTKIMNHNHFQWETKHIDWVETKQTSTLFVQSLCTTQKVNISSFLILRISRIHMLPSSPPGRTCPVNRWNKPTY